MNSQHQSNKMSRGKVISRTEAQRKRSIKIIVILAAIFLGTVVLYFVLQGIVNYMESLEDSEDDRGQSIIFYEIDYDKNIFEDKGYLDLDRNIYYSDPQSGVTVSVNPDTLDAIQSGEREYVSVICDFIDYAIYGDADSLNLLFSDEYIEAGGDLKGDFTMQMLYNIKITQITSASETVDGEIVTSYDYWLEYMIRRNNGTFRNDMGSDCTRKEYIRITNRNGDFKIDVLAPYRTK